jgi:3-oxoacyl-[acyl-carrier-protein] synthase II
MSARVVVTGIGAVSPNGIGRENFWQATRRGESGIGPITRFDAARFAVRIAGEVKGFDEQKYVSAKDRPHVSRVVPLAIAAVQEALEDAGIEAAHMNRDQLRQIGVICGSGGGSQEFAEEQYRLYYEGRHETVQRLRNPHLDDRHAGQRDLHAVWVPRILTYHLDRVHVLD